MPAGTCDMEEAETLVDEDLQDHLCISWSGTHRRTPIMLFYAETLVTKDGSIRSIGERYNLSFKIVRTESRLVREILSNHGFHEVHPTSNDFNLMWTGSHLKPYLLRGLQSFQKVNHFPRSYELTRKDRLYKNIQRMQQAHGHKNFHFIPQTFMLPSEYQEFCSSFSKDKGPWIIKPVASSRGRGIYLVSNPSQISLDENILVSRYINNPLLIDDFKFDVRLYVLVTSYDPVTIYLYEEGLARFATVKYDHNTKNIKNQFMHLTNYSVNKKSGDYVSCDDPEVEDYGNKWSMSAVLRYFRRQGRDTTSLMGQIEDLVIKALLSAELQIASACKTFIPHRTNCFELYGFDVLIDTNLKPWLLEVNLSPSLACDSPLDLKIKASMISDMFSLIGIVCQDPLLRELRLDRAAQDPSLKSQTQRAQQRPYSANSSEKGGNKRRNQGDSTISLTSEETHALRRVQEEYERRGGFIRIFPTSDTWELYSGYLEYKTNMNSMLASKLFPGRSGKAAVASKSRSRASAAGVLDGDGCQVGHVLQYERKLLSLEARSLRRRHSARRSAGGRGGAVVARRCRENSSVSSEGEAEEAEELPPVAGSDLCVHHAKEEQRDTALVRGTHVSGDASVVSKPQVNLLYILQQGWHLSKVQARVAFSCYLQRVQKRLQTESRMSGRPSCPEKDNEQMELIIRFLRRAAGNLQHNMKMDLPSSQLPPQDRCRILSHQLGEFIRCYNKETHQMDQKPEKMKDEDRCINPSVFQDFIVKACENDLEEVLTFYTKRNKSASVFLGTKSHNSKPEQNGSLCPGSENLESANHPEWESAKSAAGSKAQEVDVPVDAAQSGDLFGNKGVRTNVGPQRVNNVIEVKTHRLTVREMPPNYVSASEMKNRELLTTKDVRTADFHKMTVKVSEREAPPTYQAQHHTLAPPCSAAFNGDHMFIRHCSSPAQPQSSHHPSQQPTCSHHLAQPLPVSHAERGWHSPVFSMLNSSCTQVMTFSPMSGPATGSLQAVQSSAPKSTMASSPLTCQPSSSVSERSKSSLHRLRPGSGGALKELDTPSSQHNQQSIAAALRNLVEKQAGQPHSASSHISLLTQHLTNLNLANGVLRNNNLPLSQGLHNWPMKSPYLESGLNSVSRTTQERLSRRAGEAQSVGHLVRGSSQSPASSYQLQFAIQQLQQQKQKSSQLLRQSRDRHQAILSAHVLNRWPGDGASRPKTSPLPASKTLVNYSLQPNPAPCPTPSHTQLTPLHAPKLPNTSREPLHAANPPQHPLRGSS